MTGLGRWLWKQGDRVGVLLFTIAAGLNWADPTRLIGAGDNFPTYALNASKQLSNALFMISTLSAGVGMPDIQFTSLIPAALARILVGAGLAPNFVQLLLTALVFGATGLGVVELLRALKIRWAGRVAGAIFALSNLFMAMLFPGLAQMLTVGFVAWSGALWLRLLRQPNWTRTIAWVLPTVLLSFLFMNPPMVGVWLLFILVLTLGAAWAERLDWRALVPYVGAAAIGVMLLNAWWIYAFVVAYFGPDSAGGSFTLGRNWDWVMKRSSLANIVTFQSSWVWWDPLYVPWSSFYKARVVQVLLFLPFVVILGLGAWKRRLARWDRVLLLGTALFMFLSKGTHEPLGTVNRWIMEHIPGMWLFRGPNMQLGIIQVILMVCLVARSADAAAAFLHVHKWPKRRALAASGLGLALLTAVGGYPLLNGSVLPDYQHGLPGSYVAIPKYWSELRQYLNENKVAGRVVVLPADDYYQMKYSWGFYGADMVPFALLDQDAVLITDASSYLASAKNYNGTLQAFWRKLMSGQEPTSELEALGAQYVLLRGDIESIPGRSVVSGTAVEEMIARQAGLTLQRSFGPLKLYAVSQPSPVVEARVQPSAPGQTPSVTAYSQVVRLSPTHYRGTVESDQPVTLALKTVQNRGWDLKVAGVPNPQRVTAFGYANGWRLPAGRYQFEIVYAPQRIYTLLMVLAALLLAALLTVRALGPERLRFLRRKERNTSW